MGLFSTKKDGLRNYSMPEYLSNMRVKVYTKENKYLGYLSDITIFNKLKVSEDYADAKQFKTQKGLKSFIKNKVDNKKYNFEIA